MANRIGQQLGNYRLLRLLGRGGFAEVYLAQHIYLHRLVALKVLHTSLSDEEVEPFLAEAQTLARLAHPNIVPVFDFAVEDATPFLVMEYAARGTLRQMHPRGSCLSLATAAFYVKQVAAALQYAHNHRVIHRDVKPENMLLGPQQELLLSDFGLALFAPSPEQVNTQEMAGTLPYMAPEQIRGKPEFASDQYGLGMVAYEWLTGVRPFEGKSWQVAYQHLSVEPPRLREKDPSLPEEVEAVVLKAIAKKPQDRYVSVQLFAQALERACERSLPDHNSTNVEERTSPLVALFSERISASKKIFIAAAPADAALVAHLRTDLQQQGVAIWNAESGDTRQTPDPQDRIRQAIRAVDFVVLVLSSQTQAWHMVKEYLHLAGLYQRRLVFVWMEGEVSIPPLVDAGGKSGGVEVIDARSARYHAAIDELVACLREDTRQAEPVVADSTFEPRNPYKGLRAFTQADVTDFFGREALIEELVDRVKALLDGERPVRLLSVIGASGSGKSSLVMAGLLPQLQQGVLPESEHWVYLEPMVPGSHPVETLTLKLAACFPETSVKSIREDLEDESARGLHLLASHLSKTPGQRVVLLIDQFEELLTLTASEEERQHFIKLLLVAVTAPQGSVTVLLTLRTDFYDRLAAYPTLGRLIVEQQVVVWSMESEDLRAVIKRPAELPDVQLTFEGNLVGDLLFDVQGQVGALPLLAFTLEQLFERRRGHRLTLSAYRELGGVKGALSQHTEQTYASLPSEEHRRLARSVFLRLIDPGVSEQDTTRRRAALSEFTLDDATQTRLLRETIDAFIAARLLTTNKVSETTTIEVSHEAVIGEWRRLADWIREVREDIILQQTISEDTMEWLRRGKPADRLYRGTQLSEAQQWAERNIPSTNEMAFLQASAAEHRQREAAERFRQARELTLQHRSVNRLRFSIVALSIFSVIVIVLAIVAQVNFQQAETQRLQKQLKAQSLQREQQIALSRALAQEANNALLNKQLDLALLLSVTASKVANSDEARDSLLTSLEHSSQIATILRSDVGRMRTLMFTSDSQTILAAGDDSSIPVLWDIPTRKARHLPFASHQQDSVIVALSPDGQVLASADETGLRLWNTMTGTQLVQLGDQGRVLALAFSPSGKLLASGDEFGVITLWDVTTGKRVGQPFPGNTRPVWRIVFSQDETRLAIGTCDSAYIWDSASMRSCLQLSGQIMVWDLVAGKPLHLKLAVDSAEVRSVAFSPDGRTLASGNQQGTIVLRDVATGQQIGQPLTGHTAEVRSVAFSPDGRMLASGSFDNTVRLWDTTTGQPIGQPLLGHTTEVRNVAFSPDGRMLASGSSDGVIILWKVVPDNITLLQQTDLKEIGFPYSAAISPDGKLVAMSGDTLWLWDTTTGKRMKQITASSSGALSGVAFSPDGQSLAVGNADGSITLWDIATDKPLGLPFISKSGGVESIVFSPDGRTLASATREGGTITLWDIATRKPMKVLRQIARSLAFHPNGQILASGNFDGSVTLWNITTGKPIGIPLKSQAGDVWSVAFSPDGKELASDNQTETGGDIMITVWSLETPTPTPLAHPFMDNHSELNVIVFGPSNGQLLALTTRILPSASDLYLITRRDTSVGVWQANACSIANRNLTQQEWLKFVKDIPYRKICPDLPT